MMSWLCWCEMNVVRRRFKCCWLCAQMLLSLLKTIMDYSWGQLNWIFTVYLYIRITNTGIKRGSWNFVWWAMVRKPESLSCLVGSYNRTWSVRDRTEQHIIDGRNTVCLLFFLTDHIRSLEGSISELIRGNEKHGREDSLQSTNCDEVLEKFSFFSSLQTLSFKWHL